MTAEKRYNISLFITSIGLNERIYYSDFLLPVCPAGISLNYEKHNVANNAKNVFFPFSNKVMKSYELV